MVDATAGQSSPRRLPNRMMPDAAGQSSPLPGAQVINELGPSRFDFKVRALRGELDPPAWQDNSDQAQGVILSALLPWPAPYTFQVRVAAGRCGRHHTGR